MSEALDEKGKGKMVREEDLRSCDMEEVRVCVCLF